LLETNHKTLPLPYL